MKVRVNQNHICVFTQYVYKGVHTVILAEDHQVYGV